MKGGFDPPLCFDAPRSIQARARLNCSTNAGIITTLQTRSTAFQHSLGRHCAKLSAEQLGKTWSLTQLRMQTRPLRASNQFAPKLYVADLLKADCVEWRTLTEGSFQLDGAAFKFQRVWLQVRFCDCAARLTCIHVAHIRTGQLSSS